MNMNERLNSAYQTGGSAKEIKKPMFEKVNRQVGEILHAGATAKKTAAAPLDESTARTAASQKPSFIKTTVSHEAVKDAASVFTAHGLVKVPEKPREEDGRENVYRRVAKFLLLIGENEAAKILPHLTDEQIERIIPEIASIRHVDKDEAEVILAEFQSLVQKSREDGGVDTARTILEKAFGADKAESMLSKAMPFKGAKPFEYLAEADSDRVLQLLKDEGGAVRSLVLSYLNPKVSAAVIQSLPPDEKKDVIVRLARLKELNPEVVRRVDEAMKEKMDSLATEKSDRIDGRSALAQILKKMPLGAEEEILGNLSAQDPDLGADLRNRLFTEEDIINADNRFVAETLHGMDNVEIALLIAGKDDAFRKKILSNVSQNRAGLILDEEDARKPLLRRDCEKITALFFATLRRAWEDGTLIIKGRDEDVYI